MTTEQDRQKAREIVKQFADGERLDVAAIHDNLEGLVVAIAAYGEEVRRETWRAAIEIAKQPINTLGWGSASGGIAQKVIVDQLEAAAKK